MCGRKAQCLVDPSDAFGPRACGAHLIDVHMTNPDWISRGNCIICRRERGITCVMFKGKGPTLYCANCKRQIRKTGQDSGSLGTYLGSHFVERNAQVL